MGGPFDVKVEAQDSVIVVREFELLSRHYTYFRKNTLGKGINPFIL